MRKLTLYCPSFVTAPLGQRHPVEFALARASSTDGCKQLEPPGTDTLRSDEAAPQPQLAPQGDACLSEKDVPPMSPKLLGNAAATSHKRIKDCSLSSRAYLLPLNIRGSNIDLYSAVRQTNPQQLAYNAKYGDSVYSGDKCAGKAHGDGTRKYTDGTFESGRFENDQFTYGKRILPNGNTEEGHFVENLLQGEGRRIFATGAHAEQALQGLFKEGECYRGNKFYSKGEVYEGEMHNGIEHGHGTHRDAAGTIYVGMFRHGLKHGLGKAVFAAGAFYPGHPKHNRGTMGERTRKAKFGDVYEGAWAYGKPHGLGKQTYANGHTYEGYLFNGHRQGQGCYISVTGRTYSGNWTNGHAHGQGTRIDANGDRYEGGWQNGRPHGRGKRITADGAIYEGDWREAKISGEGIHTWPTGHVYKGSFQNSRRHGRGTFKFPNGGRFAGYFKRDKRIKSDIENTNFRGLWSKMPATMDTSPSE